LGRKVACWSAKAAISLKRVKIDEKLLWRAYRKSLLLSVDTRQSAELILDYIISLAPNPAPNPTPNPNLNTTPIPNPTRISNPNPQP